MHEHTKLIFLLLVFLAGQPTEFRGVSNNSKSITFTWKPPQNTSGMIIITNYIFQCSVPGNEVTHNLNINSSQTTITLTGLMPYTSYYCRITALTSGGEGPAATTSVTTLQDSEYSILLKSTIIVSAVPSGQPQTLIFSTTSHTLTLSWSPPLSSQRNGVIISYLITYSSGGSIINSTRTSSTSLTISGLQPFTNYTCSVRAATIVGDGPATMLDIVTSEDSKTTKKIPFA